MSDGAAAEMRVGMHSNIVNAAPASSGAEPWIRLGQSQKMAGDYEAAINSYHRALQVDKDQVLALISLGLLYLHKNDVAGAIALLRRATIVDDAAHQAWDALGLAEMANGAAERACAAHRTACALEPTHIGYALHYIDACVASGQSDHLMTACLARNRQDQADIVALVMLGRLVADQGRIAEAEDYLEAAHLLDPSAAEIPLLLASICSTAMRPHRTAKYLRAAYELRPNDLAIANDLAVALSRCYHYHEAASLLREAMGRLGENIMTLCNLANVLAASGDIELALSMAEKARLLAPDNALPWRILANLRPYQYGASVQNILDAAEQAAKCLTRPAATTICRHARPHKPLRIGLLSNTLRTHPVGWLTLAGFEQLDAQSFELHCFGHCELSDPLTRRYAAKAQAWHDISRLNDHQVAAQIAAQQVDILIDLGGNGDSGRMSVCAHRPAPVQVKWVGMQCHSSGLREMDYFIADRWEIPVSHEQYYTEKPLILNDGYVCYLPPEPLPVSSLPAMQRGHVTFGSMNNLTKINPRCIAVWASILRQMPTARFLMRCPQASEAAPRRLVIDWFAAEGIPADRLILRGRASHREFLETYQEIDIALDSFPYSGGLTTCEALFMGVPVVSLVGDSFAARHSFSHLSNVGLGDWAVHDEKSYVARALEAAADLAGLADLRLRLRALMLASPLCDAPRFGHNLGLALERIWADYCGSS